MMKMKCIAAFLASVFLICAAAAQNISSLQTANEDWKVSADNGVNITLSGGVNGQPMTVVVKAAGGKESFPRLFAGMHTAQDWRKYKKITMQVKLTSSNKDLMANGKEFAFCINDLGLRHTNIDGNPMVQQLFQRAKIKAGDWQELSLDISGAERGQVLCFEIHFYEMPYSYKHEFTVEIKDLKLIGDDRNRIAFDGGSFSPAVLQADAGAAVGTVKSSSGFALTVGANGGIAKVEQNNILMGDGAKGLSGVLVRDAAANSAPVMPKGNILLSDNAITQSAIVQELNLKINARYAAQGDAITVTGMVESLTAADRAVTIYVAIPVKSGNWNFYQSLTRSVMPFKEGERVPQYEVKVTDYPFTAVTNVTTDQGLGLGVDPGKPCTYRLEFNPKLGLFYIAIDMALVNITNINGKSLKESSFTAIIYPADSAWGMRSAADRYYKLFPEYYVDRIKQGGGWEVPSLKQKSNQSEEDVLSGGYRFVWGADELSIAEWNWNASKKILNFIYVEPEFFQFSMGDCKSPTTDETLQRMKTLSEDDAAEWAKFLPLHYSTAYNCNPHAKSADRKSFLQALIQGSFSSGMYDKNDRPALGLGNRIAWIGDSGFGAMIPCNLNPAIPKGRGQAIFTAMFEPMLAEYEKEGRAPPDGFALDSFMLMPVDYRRENFKYATLPLAFDPETFKPMVQRGFGTIEWLRELTKRYHPAGMTVMANCGNITLASPMIDIFGIEATCVQNPELLRTLAGPNKQCTYLPYDPQPKAGVERHMLFNIYPGRNVTVDILRPMIPVLDRMQAATWQPVTYATASGDVKIERYGKTGGTLYFVINNLSKNSVTSIVKFDSTKLGFDGNASVKAIYPVEKELDYKPSMEIKLGSEELTVIEVKGK